MRISSIVRLSLLFASAALAGCGGVTENSTSPGREAGAADVTGTHVTSPGNDAGGRDATIVTTNSACDALVACCHSPKIADPSACIAVAASGGLTSAACASELQVYEANGLCSVDAGQGGTPDATTGIVDVSQPPPPTDAFVSPPTDAFISPPTDAFISPPPPTGDASSEGGPLPPANMCTPSCTAPQVCILLPGAPVGTCGAACQSDSDCPGLLSCQGGVCTAQCTTCPAGQQCGSIGGAFGKRCTTNTDCSVGSYCEAGGPFGMCVPYEGCVECTGGCQTCTSNSQCSNGLVCEGNVCVTCASNSQCGPTGSCTTTHTGAQCTCTAASDCGSGQSCSSGVCNPGPVSGCESGLPGTECATGKACVNNTCGPCSTFTDCNRVSGFAGPNQGPSGLVCIDGACTACTANSQCGGGMACVGGTCGTCAVASQCGPTGQCTDGFCTCSTNAQCATGERCGSGVCVTM